MHEDENRIRRARRRGPWLPYVLVASVGLNLLVAGLIGGILLRGTPEIGHMPERNIAILGLRPYYRALGDIDRRALLLSLRQNKPAFLSGPAGLKAHLSALATVLETEPFDENAVAAVLEKQRLVIAEKLAFGHRLLLERLSAMTPERRVAFAKTLRHPPRQSSKRRSLKRRN